jgi:hypothetical protein
MHGTQLHDSTGVALRATLATAVVALGSLAAPLVADGIVSGDDRVELGAALSQPHVLEGDVADVIVRVRGASICSGTPITGTPYVITAAHCILDRDGDVTTVDVVRDGVVYSPRAALVNPRYHDAPGAQLDAAVLVMDRAILGPSASLGDTVPTKGLVTLAGLQPIDTDGTLLRGTSYDDRPTPKGVTGGVIEIKSLPAGCVERASSVEIAPNQLKVHCGLIPGGSGGGLFTEHDGRPVLLGIISTVKFDLSFNGLTPLAAVHELLNHPREYTHALAEERLLAPQPPIIRA